MSETEALVIERIKKMMTERKIIQSDLAKKLKIHQYDISRMLNGKRFPSLDELIKISQYLDCSIYYLIGIQEESYRELSPESAKIADAYSSSSDEMKVIIKRILNI